VRPERPTSTYDVRTTEARGDDRTRVLKHGDTFGVFNRFGDIGPLGVQEHGLYHGGTRYLSWFELRLGGHQPLLLSSSVDADNIVLSVDLTNPDLEQGEGHALARGQLHVYRSRFLHHDTAIERIRVSNFGLKRINTVLTLLADSDFADVFEVRGIQRGARGAVLPAESIARGLLLAYQGLDGRTRRTWIETNPSPSRLLHGSEINFDLQIAPHASSEILVTVQCDAGTGHRESMVQPVQALDAITRERAELGKGRATLLSSNPQFDQWVSRSIADVSMMLTDTSSGTYPYAGIPWYSTPFGRDGIITALQTLWLDPSIARGVLTFLAATQAEAFDPQQDAQPGKILHELRHGEMATLGEVPFGRYYGSVDATPLFVVLAGRYLARTDDRALLRGIWPNILAALRWIDEFGDVDHDGFVDYARMGPRGLVNQGWKDSSDAIFHANGAQARPPIALAEVQAYVYAAKRSVAWIAERLGDPRLASQWRAEAETLQARFENAFWCDDLGTYAIALDGDKCPCRVRTSNAGHVLFAGLASPDRASRVAETLMNDSSFSGWGIRTLADKESAYNPMSYHNGSVWPHDNALIAQGFAQYGLSQPVLTLFTSLFEATQRFDLSRMPELFCGFKRRVGEAPTLYPVACAPQAWSSAAVFAMIEAVLGLEIDAYTRRVCFSRARLPRWLSEIRIENLHIGDGQVSLRCERRDDDVAISVMARDGATVSVVNTK
jgi:glycogen debranching enzyme